MALEAIVSLTTEEKKELTDMLVGRVPNIRDRRKTVTERMKLNHAAWRGT
ncbi:hypothetical protein LCGC14_1471690, partial [marine sediment metagenome]